MLSIILRLLLFIIINFTNIQIMTIAFFVSNSFKMNTIIDLDDVAYITYNMSSEKPLILLQSFLCLFFSI